MEPISLFPYNEAALKTIIYDVVKTALANQNIGSQQLSHQPHIKGIHQLAKFLGISPSKAQRLKNEGIIPFFQNERLVLFDPDRVRESMANYNKRRTK